MLDEFRNAYPKGSLISELLSIYQGKYLVRVLAIVDRVTLATGLAAEDTLEMAEDRARLRALSALDLHPKFTSTATSLSSDPIWSHQPSPALSDRETHSPSRPQPGEAVTTELPMDYARSTPPPPATASDEWLSSSPQEAIASWPDRAKSFESVETAPAVSTASANVSANVSQSGVATETELARSPEFESHTGSAIHEKQRVDPEEKAPEKNLWSEEERKAKISESSEEIRRLGWDNQQGRSFLQQHYKCRARSQLTDEQLLEFLNYLKTQPTPT